MMVNKRELSQVRDGEQGGEFSQVRDVDKEIVYCVLYCIDR